MKSTVPGASRRAIICPCEVTASFSAASGVGQREVGAGQRIRSRGQQAAAELGHAADRLHAPVDRLLARDAAHFDEVHAGGGGCIGVGDRRTAGSCPGCALNSASPGRGERHHGRAAFGHHGELHRGERLRECQVRERHAILAGVTHGERRVEHLVAFPAAADSARKWSR